MSALAELCARRGAIVGSKPRFFAGRGDAIVFRNAAYRAAGLEVEGSPGEVPSHPRFPPRRVTLLARRQGAPRALHNMAEVEAVLRASGLEVDVVMDPKLESLSFSEQVALMARTGVLVSAHGGALANMAFLPAHAAVIELFPAGLRSQRYASLAPSLDLHYAALHSRAWLPASERGGATDRHYTKDFYADCVAQNATGFEALARHACRSAAASAPVLVDVARLAERLEDAVDIIGAFSLQNPEWAREAARLGIAPPTFEQWKESWKEE